MRKPNELIATGVFMVTILGVATVAPVIPAMVKITSSYQRLGLWNCKHRVCKVANEKANTYMFSGIEPQEDLSGEINPVKLIIT